MLALAHHLSDSSRGSELTGYAEAARVLGLTRARLTQVMGLLLLVPKVQELILRGDLLSVIGAVATPGVPTG